MSVRRDIIGDLLCGGRIRYATRKRAEQAARELFQETGRWCRSYGCETCLAWHLVDLRSYTGTAQHVRDEFEWAGDQRAA